MLVLLHQRLSNAIEEEEKKHDSFTALCDYHHFFYEVVLFVAS